MIKVELKKNILKDWISYKSGKSPWKNFYREKNVHHKRIFFVRLDAAIASDIRFMCVELKIKLNFLKYIIFISIFKK